MRRWPISEELNLDDDIGYRGKVSTHFELGHPLLHRNIYFLVFETSMSGTEFQLAAIIRKMRKMYTGNTNEQMKTSFS